MQAKLAFLLTPIATTFAFAPHNLACHFLKVNGLVTKGGESTIALALFPESIQRLELQQGILSETHALILAAQENDISLEDSFQDDIDLFGDPTIRALVIGFGVLVILATLAKFFLNQMDSAIEKVLVDFESTMKKKYESRWNTIEANLDGLAEPERSQRLFEIMEGLEQSEPAFMEKVKREM
jgi:hypothetical protein